VRLHCLHGFLGSPHDWDDLAAALRESLPALAAPGALLTPDLFGADAFAHADSIPAWAEAYGRREAQARLPGPRAAGNYLLGYSLGGRLALHLAVQFPALWDGVIIVGANPGLDSEEARARRRTHDEAWARRFEDEPWDALLAAWDAQPVFAGRGGGPRRRREQDFARVQLAGALRRWSLGAQVPLWPALRGIPCPVLWVAGAEDAGQADICRRVGETIPGVEVWVAPDAGHRVPWEQPRAFAARAAGFLRAAQYQLEEGGPQDRVSEGEL